MIKSKRRPLNKGNSSAKFRHSVGKTHKKNMQPKPMRGGIRL